MKTKNITYFTLIFLLAVLFVRADAQALPDSLVRTSDLPVHSTAGDSVQTDSKKFPAKKKKSDLAGPIKYWAEKITLRDEGSQIYLRGRAKIIYQSMTLTAEDILIDRNKETLFANGVLDSLDADSNKILRGTPVFTEKGQNPLLGTSIEYNFGTERGKIFTGKTEMEPGYYRGDRINRIADSTLLVQDGIFTSCEHIDDPHFYFKSSKIRLRVKDKVIAKPIVFYIADIPLAWLPFGIFPNKRGRHSGIVIPSYGENQTGGRFLRGMGYYWAPNDYLDAEFLVDYYDKLDFAYRASAHYTKRYTLNGNFNAEYYPRDPSSGGLSERWRLGFNHRHNIDPTMSISGSGSFVSDRTLVKDLSPNIEDRLNQNVTSRLTFNKRWQGTKNSMTVSMSRNENLQTGSTSYTLPSMSFSRSQSSIYETITGNKIGSKPGWYQKVYFSYNSSLIHKGAKTWNSKDSSFTESETQGMQHSMNFSAPQKLFKYITLNPNMSFRSDWVDEITDAEYNPETKLIEETQKKQFAARQTFSTGISAQTNIYGMFNPNLSFLKFIRHKLTPSVSFSYTPDFSSDTYGYFNTVYDSSGVKQKIDKYKKSPYGGTSSRESKRMSLRLGNLFQGKTIDEEGKEKKFDLLTANFNTSYDFMKDSLKWSNLSTSLSTRVLGKNLSVSMTHSFYKYKKVSEYSYVQINEFEKFPQLLSLNTSLGFTLNEKTFSKKEKEEKKDETSDENEGILKTDPAVKKRSDYRDQTKNIKIPWSTSFNVNYSYNSHSVQKERINLSARANLQLTQNWKISWNAYYDMVAKRVTSQSFNIYRDLHCWEMSVGWQPSIGYYDFRINVKSSALQDIKLTKHPTAASRFRY